MSRLLGISVLLAGLCGSWYFFQHYTIVGLDQVHIVPASSGAGSAASRTAGGDVDTIGAIRIATFNLDAFGQAKLREPGIVARLVDIFSRFDVTAVQEVRSRRSDVVAALVGHINAKGYHYDYVLGPRVGPDDRKEQFAFIFNTDTLEVDRPAVYTVRDPQGLFTFPPLVTAWRVRGIDPDLAFTFVLVNVHFDEPEGGSERRWLPRLVREVQRASRGEDDVIVLGDFHTSARQLHDLAPQMPGMLAVNRSSPTDVRMTRSLDNILVRLPACREFTGKTGVMDVLRTYNLSLQQALQISEHLPVWATFDAREAVGSR